LGEPDLPETTRIAIIVPVIGVAAIGAILAGVIWYKRRRGQKLKQAKRIHDALTQRMSSPPEGAN